MEVLSAKATRSIEQIREMIVEKLVELSVREGVIKENEIDVYNYTIGILLSSLLSFITVIIISLVFKQVKGVIIFLIVLIPLRENSGGFHLKAKISCFICTTLISFLVMLIPYMRFHEQIIPYLLVLIVPLSVLILVLSPQCSENKPITKAEKILCKKRTVVIVVISVLSTLALIALKASLIAVYYISMALFIDAVSLLIMAIENRIIKHSN